MKKSKHNLAAWSSMIGLLVIAGICLWTTRGMSLFPAPAPAETHGPFTTHFTRTEDPISQGGIWLNGGLDGIDWTNVRTEHGIAFGTEPGGHRKPPQEYDDSAAILKGHWGPNQTVQGTVYSVHPNQNGKVWEEVELRLRSTIKPHWCTGYEVMFRCTKIPQAYVNIAKWDGRLGKFTWLKRLGGSRYGVKTGDVVKASMIGKILTVYINGVQVARISDGTFSSGNPGIGFFLDGATGLNADYGFSSFSATDR